MKLFKQPVTNFASHLVRTTLLATAVSSVMFISGCDKSSNTPDVGTEEVKTQTVDDAQSATPTVQTQADTTAAQAMIDQVLAAMASAFKMANEMQATQNNGATTFTDKQIECFITSDNDLAVEKFQEYLEVSFTPEELNEINTFYQSDAGKKQIEMTKKMIDGLMGGEEFNLVTMQEEMGADDLSKVNEFWQSKTGLKLQQTLNDKQALAPYVEPFVEAKKEHCDMPTT